MHEDAQWCRRRGSLLDGRPIVPLEDFHQMMQDGRFLRFSVLRLIPLQRPAPTIVMHRNGNLNSSLCVLANRPASATR
jgi:hypothetical protein